MTRPDWAAGPEWEGWEGINRAQDILARKYIHEKTVCILEVHNYGQLMFWDGEGWISITTFPSPESALRIANAIAAEFGGWAS